MEVKELSIGTINVRFKRARVERIIDKKHYLVGTTTCRIVQNGTDLATGTASCNVKDAFNLNVGRIRALSKALGNLDLSKQDRTKVWDSYKTLTKIPRW